MIRVSRFFIVAAVLAADCEALERSEFLNSLSLDGRRRRQRRVARVALQAPRYSAFITLFLSGCDSSLITVYSVDHTEFRSLLSIFKPLYNQYSPYSDNGSIRMMNLSTFRERTRSMNALQCLGLILMWTQSCGNVSFLCMIFGITDSVCTLFFRFARRIIIQVLRNDARAKIQMPSDEDLLNLQRAITDRHPSLKKIGLHRSRWTEVSSGASWWTCDTEPLLQWVDTRPLRKQCFCIRSHREGHRMYYQLSRLHT